MTILVQIFHRLSSRATLKLCGFLRGTDAWGHMETIAYTPVGLNAGTVDPEILNVLLGCINVLALAIDHL